MTKETYLLVVLAPPSVVVASLAPVPAPVPALRRGRRRRRPIQLAAEQGSAGKAGAQAQRCQSCQCRRLGRVGGGKDGAGAVQDGDANGGPRQGRTTDGDQQQEQSMSSHFSSGDKKCVYLLRLAITE